MDNEKVSVDSAGRGYSDEEISNIYELGRLYLESGNIKAGENIMRGLTEIAPGFNPGWFGLSYIQSMNKNHDAAIAAARQALRNDQNSVEAQLFLVSYLLTVGDFNSAGTYLGEVGEIIDTRSIENQNIVRFYRAQLARYQSR